MIRTHTGCLKRNTDENKPHIVGSIAFPFSETIKALFETDMGIRLGFSQKYENYWHSIQNEDEFQNITEWIRLQGSRIFLRSTLDLCIALDCNHVSDSDSNYTELGQLEHDAKKYRDASAVESLSLRCVEAIRSLPFYRDAPLIAAVPPMCNKTFHLPVQIADFVATALGKENLTPHFVCAKPKEKSLKRASIEEKWGILEATGLELKHKIPDDTDVILIDDKYQSGTTMQFVAMKLQEAGARYIFGISLVKTLGDTDNAS